jgi:hypothetical protein
MLALELPGRYQGDSVRFLTSRVSVVQGHKVSVEGPPFQQCRWDEKYNDSYSEQHSRKLFPTVVPQTVQLMEKVCIYPRAISQRQHWVIFNLHLPLMTINPLLKFYEPTLYNFRLPYSAWNIPLWLHNYVTEIYLKLNFSAPLKLRIQSFFRLCTPQICILVWSDWRWVLLCLRHFSSNLNTVRRLATGNIVDEGMALLEILSLKILT